MPQPTTASAWITGIVDMLNTIGIDAQSQLKRADIDADLLKNPHTRFDTDKMSRLWESITASTGDPAIALRSSEIPRPASLDLLAYTMMTAPTMLAALERMRQFIRVISDAANFTLTQESQGYWLRLEIYSGNIPIPRQRFEYVLITILNVCRWISVGRFNPLALELHSPRPLDVQPYLNAFACPLYFDAPACGLLFSPDDLAVPLPASNPTLAALHERYASDFLARMDEGKISHKIRDLIIRSLPDGDPPRSAAAALMCVSERTLQRRLQEEGTSFQQLVDDTRRGLAAQYLAQGQMGIGQIAYMLGFADQSIFSRACQRWFTLSPRQYRQKLSDDGQHADLTANN